MSNNTTAPTASFHDDRIALGNWYPPLRELDVPTPRTHAVSIEKGDDGRPTWDTDRAVGLVDDLGGEAFVRSDYKSASIGLEEGSHIHEATAEAVDRTISELIDQHIMMSMPMDGRVLLREWLPLEWNVYTRSSLHPEVRAFIRDGEVVCHHPRLEWRDDPDGSEFVEKAEDIIDRHWNDEVCPLAERVAEAFDGEGWYSVDFVLTTDYRWYCTDMALDAMYERGGEWRGISEHPGDCEHDVANMVVPGGGDDE